MEPTKKVLWTDENLLIEVTYKTDVIEDKKNESHSGVLSAIPIFIIGMLFCLIVQLGYTIFTKKDPIAKIVDITPYKTEYSKYKDVKLPKSIKISTNHHEYIVEIYGDLGKGYLYENGGKYGGMLEESVRDNNQPIYFPDSCQAKYAVLKWFEQNDNPKAKLKNFR